MILTAILTAILTWQIASLLNGCDKIIIPNYSHVLAAVTSGLLTIVKTGTTIVSYFGNVTTSLFALTIVRKFTPR